MADSLTAICLNILLPRLSFQDIFLNIVHNFIVQPTIKNIFLELSKFLTILHIKEEKNQINLHLSFLKNDIFEKKSYLNRTNNFFLPLNLKLNSFVYLCCVTLR